VSRVLCSGSIILMKVFYWLAFLFLGTTVGHIYQTVNYDRVSSVKMPTYSEPCDFKVAGGAGVYSLYSPPVVPDAQYSEIQEPLSAADLENGYDVIAAAGKSGAKDDKHQSSEVSVNEYASVSVSKVISQEKIAIISIN